MSRCLQCGAPGRLSATGAELVRLHDYSLPPVGRFQGAYAIDAWSRPARAIGGDLLAAWPVGENSLFVFLGDVMGHGTPAAVVASALRGALHQLRLSGVRSPGTILSRLNEAVCDLFSDYFVTASAGLLEAGSVICAQAGHPAMLVREGRKVTAVSVRSLPLGLTPGYEYEEKKVDLSPGGTLVLYSDGVADALAGSGQPALESLIEIVRRSRASAAELVRSVRRALARDRGKRYDDRAVLAVQRLSEEE